MRLSMAPLVFVVAIGFILFGSGQTFGAARSGNQVEICLKGGRDEKVGLELPLQYLAFPNKISAKSVDEVVLSIFLPSSEAWSEVAEHPARWPLHIDRAKPLESQWPEAKTLVFLNFALTHGRFEDGWRGWANAQKMVPTEKSIGTLDEYVREELPTASKSYNDRSKRERYYISQAKNLMVACHFPTVYCVGRSYVDRVAFRFLIHKSILAESDNVADNLAKLFTNFLADGSKVDACRNGN